MNESYTSFAQVYDMFMDNVDYPAWSKYLIQLLKEYQVEDGLVLDLGCGTGNMTELRNREGGCEHLRFHQLYSGGRRSAGSLLARQQLSGSEGHVYF